MPIAKVIKKYKNGPDLQNCEHEDEQVMLVFMPYVTITMLIILFQKVSQMCYLIDYHDHNHDRDFLKEKKNATFLKEVDLWVMLACVRHLTHHSA